MRRFLFEDDRPVRDTPIVHGEAGVIRGRALYCVAVGLGVIATLIAVALWYAAERQEFTGFDGIYPPGSARGLVWRIADIAASGLADTGLRGRG